MAVIGRAEVEITANTKTFEKQLASSVQKAASKATTTVTPKVESKGLLGTFDKVIDQADAKLKTFGLTVRDFSAIARTAGAALVAMKVGEFVVSAVQAAAALGEQLSQSKVIFGEFATDVDAFAKNAALAFGQSETQALAASSQFGTIAKAAGLSQEAAASFSVTLTALAGDLASFKDIPIETALQALQSGLVGETESLRKLGIIVDEDTKKRAAQREGISEGNKELDAQAKILATYSEVLRQTGDAQGDFARTSDSLPNRLRAVSAQVTNLKADLGTSLLPIVTKEAGALSDLLFVFNRLGDGLNAATGRVHKFGEETDKNVSFVEHFFNAVVPGIPLVGALADALGKNKESTIEAKSAAELLALSLGDVKDESSGAALALGVVSEAAAAASQLFAQAAAGFQNRLEGLTPKFGEDFRKDAAKASGGAGKVEDAAERVARANEDADKRIGDAKRSLARQVRESNEDISDSEKKLADVEKETGRRIRDDLENLADARRDLAREEHEAQRQRIEDARQAQQAVNDAQQDFIQAQADLNAEAEDLTPEEKRARQVAALREKAVDAEQEGFRRLAAVHAEANEDKLNAADDERDIARLERTLAEDRIDSAEDVADAKLDLERTIRDSNERVEDSQRALADAETQSARAIADALKSVGKAASSAAKEEELSIASLTKSFKTQTKDLKSFRTGIDAIAKHMQSFVVDMNAIADTEIKEAFLAGLLELGPEFATVIQDLAKLSDRELQAVVEPFGEKIREAKKAADFEFDKFPANFGEKINATRVAAEHKLQDLVAAYRDAAHEGGAALETMNDAVLNQVLVLDQAVKTNLLRLDDQEQGFLDLAKSTVDPTVRIDALKALLLSLQNKNIKVTADTDPAIDSMVAFLQTMADAPFVEFVFPGIGLLEDATIARLLALKRRMAGGPVTAGDPFLIGERGPELFIPNKNGEIISNDVLLRLIKAMDERETRSAGSEAVPVTQNFYTQNTDARVLANELAFRMGRDSQR